MICMKNVSPGGIWIEREYRMSSANIRNYPDMICVTDPTIGKVLWKHSAAVLILKTSFVDETLRGVTGVPHRAVLRHLLIQVQIANDIFQPSASGHKRIENWTRTVNVNESDASNYQKK